MDPLLALLLLGSVPAGSARIAPGDSAGVVTVLGRDTIALESWVRTASRLEGGIVLRVPGTVQFRYTVDLNVDGTVRRSVVEQKPMGVPEMVSRRVTLDLIGDSVRVTIDSAGNIQRSVYPAPSGAAVLLKTGFDSSFGIYDSYGLYELLLTDPAWKLTDSLAVPALGALSGRVSTRRFVRRSPTLIDTDFFGMAWTHLTLDGDGHILDADAGATTEKTRTRRTGPIDIARAAKDFAARDRAGRGVGIASPPDSVRTSLGAAHIAIDYSSPRLRQRTILGEVVPFDRVWRTGANAATALYVDRPVRVGGTLVPPGGYSLWTLPTRSGVQLIINRQVGQWGTEYDPSRDLARIPMRISTAPAAENFSIVISGQGGSTELAIRWGTFVWSVDLKAE